MPIYEHIKGKDLLFHLQQYQMHLGWDDKQLAQYQWQALKNLLEHAFNNTEFYRQHWAKVGVVSVEDIKNLDDFAQLPVVTKQDISEHYQAIKAKNYNHNIRKATGGSTGQPFRFELDITSNTRREAIMWRGYGWLGAGLGQKTLYLWGADIGQSSTLKTLKNTLYHRFYNRKMLNSFAMNSDNMHDYVNEINIFRPTAIVSYVNPLVELAKFVLMHKIVVFSPQTILTGAEPLFDHQRQIIEQAFNCKVYNTFGCREVMLIAAECAVHNNLHINSDHLIVETIDDKGNSVVEQSGDLVITDLFNYGMPLIRYINGDRATLINEKCPCDNPLPLMKSIDGRKLDIIKTPSGKTIPGELFPHLFKEFTGIERFQIKQEKLDELQINMIVNNQFSDQDKNKIAQEINKYAQNELTLNFNFVDNIPLTASGKHRVTICEV
jgi:phenylacetate-CoA ligase